MLEQLGPSIGRLAFAAEVERGVGEVFARVKPGRPALKSNVEINAALRCVGNFRVLIESAPVFASRSGSQGLNGQVMAAAVLGSAETRVPSCGWWRAPRKTPWSGSISLPTRSDSRRRPWRTRRPQPRSGIFTAAARMAARRIEGGPAAAPSLRPSGCRAPGRDRRARSPGRALPFSSRTKRNSTLCRPGRATGILPLAKVRWRRLARRGEGRPSQVCPAERLSRKADHESRSKPSAK
jgi:hypothetical protein